MSTNQDKRRLPAFIPLMVASRGVVEFGFAVFGVAVMTEAAIV